MRDQSERAGFWKEMESHSGVGSLGPILSGESSGCTPYFLGAEL